MVGLAAVCLMILVSGVNGAINRSVASEADTCVVSAQEGLVLPDHFSRPADQPILRPNNCTIISYDPAFNTLVGNDAVLEQLGPDMAYNYAHEGAVYLRGRSPPPSTGLPGGRRASADCMIRFRVQRAVLRGATWQRQYYHCPSLETETGYRGAHRGPV